MKLNGIITKVRAVKRKAYGTSGITFVWETERGELTRTYNISRVSNGKSKLDDFLRMFPVKPPQHLSDVPLLYSTTLERLLKNIECELVIIESGNPKFPYNIESITPILTAINKYSTSLNQETLSNGEDSVG